MKMQEIRSLERLAVVITVIMSLAPLIPYGLRIGA
jgi:hypothetical protein